MQPCIFCGGDREAPDHERRCDGRQGRIEAEAEAARPGRYSRALAVYRDTSREAWASVLACLPGIDARILGYIRERDGATSEECEDALGLKHQTVSAQIRHMAEAGLLLATGEKRPTHSGRAALVWSLPGRARREGAA